MTAPLSSHERTPLDVGRVWRRDATEASRRRAKRISLAARFDDRLREPDLGTVNVLEDAGHCGAMREMPGRATASLSWPARHVLKLISASGPWAAPIFSTRSPDGKVTTMRPTSTAPRIFFKAMRARLKRGALISASPDDAARRGFSFDNIC